MDVLVTAVSGQSGGADRLGGLLDEIRVPEQPPAVSGIDVALVRDGRIARLYTLLQP